tara:strand:- start:3300 stop:4499 length:1200 start_codon:yes stop_codon:yes gene_type:complete
MVKIIDKIKNSSKLIRIEGVVLSILIVIIFSNQFHFLWLMYDFIALGSLFFYLLNNRLVLNTILIITVPYFLIFSFISGGHLISFLSIWDNAKHLFVLFMMLTLVDRYANHGRFNLFLRDIGVIFPVIFFIQIFVVNYQFFNNYFIDDVAGTFGSMSSHSLGYFCLMYLSYLLFLTKSKLNFSIVLVISLILNFMSENTGFFLLLVVLLLFNWFRFYGFKKLVFYTIFLIITVVIIDIFLGGQLISPIIYRLTKSSTNLMTGNLSVVSASRGFLMLYAFMLGGWFGLGPGSYSECYSFSGWLLNSLSDGRLQINISSVTTFLVEYGVLGLLVWIVLYLVFLRYFFKDYKTKAFVSLFFLLCLFYNKLLRDERVIFMLIFIFTFIKIRLDRYSIQSNKIK